MKGQISIEFIAAFFLFILAVIATMNFISQDIPEYEKDIEDTSRHMEAKQFTDQMLTKKGSHGYGKGGANWEQNTTTRNNVNSFGLASGYHEVEEDKLNNISTVGDEQFNYSEFRNVTGLENQYRFEFTWIPVIQTHRSFMRNSPPSNPDITEPSGPLYSDADSEVHFGKTRIHGENLHLLVTSHNGRYNTTYVSKDWDFGSNTDLPDSPQGLHDSFTFGENDFEIERFQNREDRRGATVIIQSELKQFGASLATQSTVDQFNRYAVFNAENSEKHPLRIEVFVW